VANKKIKAFPPIGNLIAHVLTGDYVYAGKVEMATIEEMGTIIKEVDAGGLKGLHDIGYFGGISAPSEEQVTEALWEVFNYLDTHLTERQKQLIVFDILLVEHALHKYSQCHVYRWV
jgi:hypothetical protein